MLVITDIHTMFAVLLNLQDKTQLSNILHSYALIRAAVYKEECNSVMTQCIFENTRNKKLN